MSASNPLENIFTLFRVLKRNLQDQLAGLPHDLAPMHIRVLKIIHHHTPCTAADISHTLDRDKAQITRLLKTLFDAQLVHKGPDAIDKRKQCLQLTPDGQALMHTIHVIDRNLTQKMTQGMVEEDIQQFEQLVNQIKCNLMQ